MAKADNTTRMVQIISAGCHDALCNSVVPRFVVMGTSVVLYLAVMGTSVVPFLVASHLVSAFVLQRSTVVNPGSQELHF